MRFRRCIWVYFELGSHLGKRRTLHSLLCEVLQRIGNIDSLVMTSPSISKFIHQFKLNLGPKFPTMQLGWSFNCMFSLFPINLWRWNYLFPHRNRFWALHTIWITWNCVSFGELPSRQCLYDCLPIVCINLSTNMSIQFSMLLSVNIIVFSLLFVNNYLKLRHNICIVKEKKKWQLDYMVIKNFGKFNVYIEWPKRSSIIYMINCMNNWT